MPKNNDDLLTRATAASLRVTELTSELKKVRAEAVALRRQVLDALGRRPRTRKPKLPNPDRATSEITKVEMPADNADVD